MEQEYNGLLSKEDVLKRKEKIIENEKRNNMYRIFLVPDKEALKKRIAFIYKQEKLLKKKRKIILIDETPNRFFKK